MKKKIVGIVLIIMLFVMLPVSIFAYGGIDTNIAIGTTNAINSSVGITNRIVGTLQVAGTIISVIALIIIGMRYMFSSVQEKAQMKGVIGYYIIGALLVFATSNILAFAYSVVDDARHNYVDAGTIRAATCVTPGLKKRVCDGPGCGCTVQEPTVIEVTTPINSNAHDWGSWVVSKNETCTENGTETRTCKNGCGKTETRARAAKGHQYSDLQVIKPETCTENGYKAEKCSNCGDEKNKEVILAIGHNYDILKVIKPETCTEDGYKARKCLNCGDEINKETINHTGHDWVATITTPATCDSQGEIVNKCSKCGECDEKTRGALEAKGHKWKKAGGREANCTLEGYTLYVCMNGCGGSEKRDKTEPLGHSYVDTNSYSCGNDFTHRRGKKCQSCGFSSWGESENCTMVFTGNKKDDTDNFFAGWDKLFEHECSSCGYTRWREHENSGNWK